MAAIRNSFKTNDWNAILECFSLSLFLFPLFLHRFREDDKAIPEGLECCAERRRSSILHLVSGGSRGFPQQIVREQRGKEEDERIQRQISQFPEAEAQKIHQT